MSLWGLSVSIEACFNVSRISSAASGYDIRPRSKCTTIDLNAGTTAEMQLAESVPESRQSLSVSCLTEWRISLSSSSHCTMAAESPSGRMDGIMNHWLSRKRPTADLLSHRAPGPVPAFHVFRHDLPATRKFPVCQAGRSAIPYERNYGQTRPFSRLTDSQVSFYKDELGRGHNCFVGA